MPVAPLRLPPAAALLPLVLATAVLASCGGGGTDDARPTTTTTSTSAPADGPPAGCEDQDPAPDAPAVEPPVSADVDGDGRDDAVTVHVVDDLTVAVAVEHAAGGRTVRSWSDETVATFAALRVAAVGDVEGDGDDDLWLVVGAGASAEVVSLVVADGCDLDRPLDGAVANAFAVGASVGAVSGVECLRADDAADVAVHDAGRSQDGAYRGTTTRWRVVDGALERVDVEPLAAEPGADPADVLRFGELGCP